MLGWQRHYGLEEKKSLLQSCIGNFRPGCSSVAAPSARMQRKDTSNYRPVPNPCQELIDKAVRADGAEEYKGSASRA